MKTKSSGHEPFSGMRMSLNGIPEEKTRFEWEIPQAAFEDCAQPTPLTGKTAVSGELFKSEETVYFTGEAEGVFNLSCSRCGGEFEAPFHTKAQAIFLPRPDGMEGPVPEEDGGDVDSIFYEEDFVDIFSPVRDQVNLAVPMRPLCREDCKGLCLKCGTDLNIKNCDCKENSGDPRFAGLKNLLNNQEG